MRWTVSFCLWTLFVWGGRVRNIAADDALSGFETSWRLALSVTFVSLALLTLGGLWRSTRVPTPCLGYVVRPFAIFTALVWLLRGGGILIDSGHEAGFKVVHTVLAVVSVALAWKADRELMADGRSADQEVTAAGSR